MKKIFRAAIALAMATSAHAAPIIGLFNTGTNASNLALAGGNGVVDTHYVIASSTSPGFAGQQAVTYYNPAYAPDDANSRWISLSGTGTPGSNTTRYRTTFSLAGLNAATASISGTWGADNSGTIFLNGVGTGITVASFGTLTAFNIAPGFFVAGLNTLEFEITDSGAPTAFRVDDLRGSADPLAGAVPEPASWAMMMLGFGLVGSALRMRRQVSVIA